MTRINTIDVKYLTDQHLRAEYLEYVIAVDLIRKSYYSRKLEGIPSEYKLGEGHILFFKNKLGYLKRRHELIKTEMKKRNFKHDLVLDFDNLPEELFSDWFPSEKDILVNFERIYQRIMLKPHWYKYYSKPIPTFFTDKYTYQKLVQFGD